ncbi:MAG: hypothetical protein ACOX0K_06695 [Oscillospiraceae bacterium]
MRYVSLPRLQEGMVLGNNIYGENFEIVMGEGLVLGNTQIRRLNELGYPGVYILDKLSEDVVVQDVIPTQLRLSTIKAAKDLRIQAERMDPKNPRKTSVTPAAEDCSFHHRSPHRQQAEGGGPHRPQAL